MTLSNLIRKGGLANIATATPATLATPETSSAATVAQVATVAVARSHPPATAMTGEEEAEIRAWLAHIEETDKDIIAEVVDKYRNDLEARRYLKRSEEVPESVTVDHPITCCGCIHFERIDHPHLGHCAKDEPETIAGLWDTDRRYCERFISRPWQPHKDQPRPVRAKAKR